MANDGLIPAYRKSKEPRAINDVCLLRSLQIMVALFKSLYYYCHRFGVLQSINKYINGKSQESTIRKGSPMDSAKWFRDTAMNNRMYLLGLLLDAAYLLPTYIIRAWFATWIMIMIVFRVAWQLRSAFPSWTHKPAQLQHGCEITTCWMFQEGTTRTTWWFGNHR